MSDRRLVGLQLVEVRPDLPLGAGGLERVAAAAAGAREDLGSGRVGSGLGARATARDEPIARMTPPLRRRSFLATARGYDSHVARDGTIQPRRAEAARRLPDLRAEDPRQAARLPRLGRRPRRSRARCSTRCATFYETSYANVHRGVYTLSERATAEYEGAREKVRGVRQRAVGARGHLHRAARPRGSTSSRTPGGSTTSARATSSSSPSSSTTRTSCPGSTSRSARAPTSG